MSNGCQALNPLHKEPEGVIGPFDNDLLPPLFTFIVMLETCNFS